MSLVLTQMNNHPLLKTNDFWDHNHSIISKLTLKFPIRLIILDRDGVINHDSDEFIKTPAEWIAIKGSLEAISLLNSSHIKVAIATNQSGVERNIFSQGHLNLIHNKMYDQLQSQNNAKINLLLYCKYSDRSHPDYKPNPGMLLKILSFFKLNPSENFIPFIGDKKSDLEAAIKVGCHPVLVMTGKGEKTLSEISSEFLINNNILVYKDLNSCVKELVGYLK